MEKRLLYFRLEILRLWMRGKAQHLPLHSNTFSRTDQICPFPWLLSPLWLQLSPLQSPQPLHRWATRQAVLCQHSAIAEAQLMVSLVKQHTLGDALGQMRLWCQTKLLHKGPTCRNLSFNLPSAAAIQYLLQLFAIKTWPKIWPLWMIQIISSNNKKGKCTVVFFSKAFNRTHLFLSFVKIYTHFLSFFLFLKRNILTQFSPSLPPFVALTKRPRFGLYTWYSITIY